MNSRTHVRFPWLLLAALQVLAVLMALPAGAQQETSKDPRSISLNAVSPTIRTARTEFFLGEQIVFEIGKRTAEEVDGPALAATACELSVVRPDGRAIVRHEGVLGPYDGPSRISFLSHMELLNDIDDRLSVGRYQIIYTCGSQKASISIQLRELPILRNIRVTLQFPAQVRLSKDKSIKIQATISNELSSPIEIVIPNSNYWARPVVYAYWEHPPARTGFVSDSEARALKDPNYRTRISFVNLDKLKLHTIPAKESYITEAEFYGSALNEGLYTDSRWLPQGQFEIVSGLVLHLFLPADAMSQDRSRPIDLLIRSKACYAATGERKSAGCEDAIEYWLPPPLDF